MDDDFLVGIEAQLMKAALNPAEWAGALDQIAHRTNSVGVALLTVAGRGPLVIPTESIAELGEVYIRDGWHARDFRYAGIDLMKSRGIYTDQDIIPGSALPRTPYYADFLEKHGVGWGMMLRIQTASDLLCLSVQRGTQRGAYQAEEQMAVLPLANIISRAAELSRQLNYRRLEEGLSITDQIGDAAFYIDRFGRVPKMNSRAEAMVLSGRIKMRDGRISLPGSDSARLLRHIDAAIWPDLRATDEALQAVAVNRTGEHPLVFRAIRIRGEIQTFFSPAHALLIATDLGEKRVAEIADLSGLLGLTKAEATLAQALMFNLNLVKAAEAVGVTHETARTQLKSVFAKTGTDSQLALLRLLQALPR